MGDMKVIGKIGQIIFFPFHLLNVFVLKCSFIVAFLIPGLYLAFCGYMAYSLYMDYQVDSSALWGIIVTVPALLFGFAIIEFINAIFITILSLVLTGTDTAYQYCHAWANGMSMDELQGKLAYIELQKEKMKEERKNAKLKKKEDAYKKGFNDAHTNNTKQTSSHADTQSEDYNEYKQKFYEEQQRRQEEQRRQQQEQQRQYQNTRTKYDEQLEKSLLVLHLKKGCTFDEVKSNYRMLSKMFHPDGANSNFDTSEAQLEINEAYQFLKAHYNN